ncbi:hypothetical protein NECID01_2033 [Nematocida sp. AWRm77]|nr:hypothetical protein NECID01_2033 [Nematocida sp. AWRm77]
MEGHGYMPLNMRSMVLFGNMLYLPIVICEQVLSPKLEIAASMAGYVVGPFFALAPFSYRTLFVVGSLLGLLPPLLVYFPMVRAFFLGMIVSYCKTTANLFVGALCVKTKKKTALVLGNLAVAWISFGTFFSLHFCPVLTKIATSLPFIVVSSLGTAAASYFYIIETPEEIMSRLEREKKKSAPYEELYKTLLYINGPNAKDSDEFHQEYKEILDKKAHVHNSASLKTRATAILIAVNFSFVYVAFQRAMGVEGVYSLYRIFLGAMSLFSWSFKYAGDSGSVLSVIFPVAALYFICVSTGSYQDLGLVLLMLLGVEAMPAHPSLYTLQRVDRAVISSLQSLLSFVCFMIVTAYITY